MPLTSLMTGPCNALCDRCASWQCCKVLTRWMGLRGMVMFLPRALPRGLGPLAGKSSMELGPPTHPCLQIAPARSNSGSRALGEAAQRVW